MGILVNREKWGWASAFETSSPGANDAGGPEIVPQPSRVSVLLVEEPSRLRAADNRKDMQWARERAGVPQACLTRLSCRYYVKQGHCLGLGQLFRHSGSRPRPHDVPPTTGLCSPAHSPLATTLFRSAANILGCQRNAMPRSTG